MDNFSDDIFEGQGEQHSPQQPSAQLSAQELKAMVGEMVAKKMKKLKRKHKKEVKKLGKKLKKAYEGDEGKKGKKGKGKHKAADSFLVKAADVAIKTALPELIRSLFDKGKRDSKKD